jgi:hypothetical protein
MHDFRREESIPGREKKVNREKEKSPSVYHACFGEERTGKDSTLRIQCKEQRTREKRNQK